MKLNFTIFHKIKALCNHINAVYHDIDDWLCQSGDMVRLAKPCQSSKCAFSLANQKAILG